MKTGKNKEALTYLHPALDTLDVVLPNKELILVDLKNNIDLMIDLQGYFILTGNPKLADAIKDQIELIYRVIAELKQDKE